LRCVYRSECRYDFPHVRSPVFVRTRVGDDRSPHRPQASRDLLSSNADGLIVRKLPEFVKKNCPTSGEFQRLVKRLATPLGLPSLRENSVLVSVAPVFRRASARFENANLKVGATIARQNKPLTRILKPLAKCPELSWQSRGRPAKLTSSNPATLRSLRTRHRKDRLSQRGGPSKDF